MYIFKNIFLVLLEMFVFFNASIVNIREPAIISDKIQIFSHLCSNIVTAPLSNFTFINSTSPLLLILLVHIENFLLSFLVLFAFLLQIYEDIMQ